MPVQPVLRRTVAIALAGGALGAKLATVGSPAQADDDAGDTAVAPAPTERTLLSPLSEGAHLLSWQVVAIDPIEMGAMRVRLRGESGATFGIEIMARDRSPIAPRPPAQSEHFALYVSNGGDGRSPTVEEQGLAAMALVQIVARNEAHLSTDGFLTHAERLARHSVALLEDGAELGSKPTGRDQRPAAPARV
jgi:hypothetical protein